LISAWTGGSLLGFFGIMIDAFRVGGGLVILDANKIHSWGGEIMLALLIAEKMRDKLGTIGLNIATRIMGLILAAIGVQFMADGIRQLLPGLA